METINDIVEHWTYQVESPFRTPQEISMLAAEPEYGGLEATREPEATFESFNGSEIIHDVEGFGEELLEDESAIYDESHRTHPHLALELTSIIRPAA